MEDTTLLDNSQQARDRAEARFARLQDGEKAWAEHNAEAVAVRDKIARLKALRLAKATVDAEAGGVKAKKPAARKAKRTA